MNLQTVHSDRAPAAIGPYSQAVRVGDLVFCSGQVALDAATGEVEEKPDSGTITVGSTVEMAFVEFFVPGVWETEWADPAVACTWAPTGTNLDGGEPTRHIAAHTSDGTVHEDV